MGPLRGVLPPADRPLSVDEVVTRVRKLIEYDEVLAHVSVEGELTDLKRHVSGHVYFLLKGQSASMNCVMFRSDAQGLLLWPQRGDRVLVTGAVRLYEARGTVQVYARKMYPLGQGAAARAKAKDFSRPNANAPFPFVRAPWPVSLPTRAPPCAT